MRSDGRLSGVLHVLLHLTERERPATSEELARAVSTHPVVVRRILAGLREHGYVASMKGHGGGWALACDLRRVTMRDVYVALGAPTLLAIGHRNNKPGCLVEAAVNAALGNACAEAEALLLARFGTITLAQLRAKIRRHAKQHRRGATAHAGAHRRSHA